MAAAAAAIGPGYDGTPELLPFVPEGRRKSSENFWPGAKEALRAVGEEGVNGGEFSPDMIELQNSVIMLVE